jgi:hypothetical protein
MQLNISRFSLWLRIGRIAILKHFEIRCNVVNIYFFSYGATAPIWALAYLHETLRFTSVF